jgi:hypothetical protein
MRIESDGTVGPDTEEARREYEEELRLIEETEYIWRTCPRTNTGRIKLILVKRKSSFYR